MSVKSHLSSDNIVPLARKVSYNEVNLILKSLNTKKAFGTDDHDETCQVSTKFSISLTMAINSSTD